MTTTGSVGLPLEDEPVVVRASLPRGLFWAIFLSLYFVAVYGFCNWFTHQRVLHGEHVRQLYFEWERKIAFYPAFIVPYMSIDLFFFASFFVCTDLRELRTHAKRVLLAITLAGVFFVVAPLRYDFPFDRPDPDGPFGWIFRFLHSFDNPYNLAPSLHIALRSLLWIVYVHHTRGLLRWGVRVWFILIGLSTIFVRQHHVIDLVSGQVLAMFCFYLFPDIKRGAWVRERGEAVPQNWIVGSLYLLALAVSLVAGVILKTWGWLMIWPGFAFAVVALAYFGLGPEVFHKSEGRLPLTTRWLLGPYLAGAYASWLAQRSKTVWVDVATNLRIGRLPDVIEATVVVNSGIVAVLDMTAEFTSPKALRDLSYLNIQVLDLTPPTVKQLRQAVRFIDEQVKRGPVFVYCALGMSRAPCVAAAYLLSTGAARSVDDAVEAVRRARPGAAMGPAHFDVLNDFVRGSDDTAKHG